MKYKVFNNRIEIADCSQFNPKHICECGQMFRFVALEGGAYILQSGSEVAKIEPKGEGYVVQTTNPTYFVKYLDLDRDYAVAKAQLAKVPQLAVSIKRGEGIRIVNADPFETIIEFIISANNNIKRISGIVERLCAVGDEVKTEFGTFRAFPSVQTLAAQPQEWYDKLGAGYRAPYLKHTADFLATCNLQLVAALPDDQLYKWLVGLKGVGPKVASCIMLFGFSRRGFFPVDTWVEQVYNNHFYCGAKTRPQIQTYFQDMFGDLSGIAQQYLFYAEREK